jgi:NAD(P)-dependent dehydrogenase (short-subunit alcohol dehydrogenase family)
MFSDAIKHLGGVDTVVNNAGYGKSGKILEIAAQEWDRTIPFNLTGTFLVRKYSLPHLLEQKSGSIINISANAGLVGL